MYDLVLRATGDVDRAKLRSTLARLPGIEIETMTMDKDWMVYDIEERAKEDRALEKRVQREFAGRSLKRCTATELRAFIRAEWGEDCPQRRCPPSKRSPASSR
jgi:hypothetical protein